MKKVLILALVLLVLFGVASCQALQSIKAVVKVTCTDEKGAAYGYLTVFLLDGPKVVVSDQLNERGIVVIQGVPPGTYTISAKNAAGIELKVLEPATVVVKPGKTVDVNLKVQSVAPANTFE